MRILNLNLLVFSFLCMTFFHQNIEAYDNEIAHRHINENAISGDSFVRTFLRTTLRFNKDINQKIGEKRIWEIISDGGYEEDEPGYRPLRHFHDPLKPWDEAGFLSQFTSMIFWAQTPEPDNDYELYNEYSWWGARNAYRNALLSGSEEEYALTFRSLGQLMHIVSDAAVPEHVRNDAHPFSRPYEEWVQNNIETLEYDDFTVDNAIFNLAVSNPSAPSPISALWDHDEYQPDGSNLPDASSNTIGLAEYTNANFWTEDTFADYPHPHLDETNYDENVWLNPEPVYAEDGETDNRIYFSKQTGEPVEHFVAAGYWYYQLSMWNKPELKHAFLLDEKCHQAYAEKLIPRAIGYSAALLDYFFRGTIAISPPEEHVYAVIDASTDQSFQTIHARLHNTTPDEEMRDGTLVAVARYKHRIDYVPDLSSNEPPVEASREDSFSYSVSAPIEIESLGSEQASAARFSFDFSADPIPAGITDLSLQVVFKGTLGSEANTAIAVGALDLAEPNHIATWNLTDWFYEQGRLMTADEIRADSASLEYLQNNCGHLLPYLDPFPMDIRLGFSASTAIAPDYIVDYTGLQPGGYGRIIVLSGQPSFAMHVRRTATAPQFDQTSRLTYAGVTNQEDDDGFTNTAVTTFRSITTHNFSGYLFYCPNLVGLGIGDWPATAGDQPVPATLLFP
jgi:hypothetical protein